MNPPMKKDQILPLVPLRDVVLYPLMQVPLFVGRKSSVAALRAAFKRQDRRFLVCAQHNPKDDELKPDSFNHTGTLAHISEMHEAADGTLRVLVRGLERAVFENPAKDDHWQAEYRVLRPFCAASDTDKQLLAQLVSESFLRCLKDKEPIKIAKEVVDIMNDGKDVGAMADSMAMHLPLSLEQRQHILEELDVCKRAEYLLGIVKSHEDLMKAERRIRSRVRKQMEKSHREYYLSEQMKAIQKELGESGGDGGDADELMKKVQAAGMPAEARDKVCAEITKLRHLPPMAGEASVLRNYIDCMLSVPWSQRSTLRHNIAGAEAILNREHYGLEEVKERILEFLAVQQRLDDIESRLRSGKPGKQGKRGKSGSILCLVGPPGVGKTSFARSIARATGREFVRMSLGGVRDEAEIRGHRRTYIGAMPGKIIQKLTRAGTRNPLFLLDEVDKIGMDWRGDPASALLEVLDPEQNSSFNDHYLDVDYDLSEVMFLCTANTTEIPEALLDRMEVIRLSGYTEDEKVNIARRYLVPRQAHNAGMKSSEFRIPMPVLRYMVRHYTSESGVRELDRLAAKLARKRVTIMARGKSPEALKVGSLEGLLGPHKYNYGRRERRNQVGQVVGLAWTRSGGDILNLEVSSVPGKGRITKTGSLGKVMQESIQAAITVVRNRSTRLGIPDDFPGQYDLHIHVPAGATPKDGPSAGVGVCCALASQLTGIAVRADVAMTGEITLRGEVLPIGGLKEKLLAARRAGMRTVIIPRENERDLVKIPGKILKSLKIVPVKRIEQALECALVSSPKIQRLGLFGERPEERIAH